MQPARTTKGTTISGIKATGPATSQITAMKRKMNGRSTKAIKVPEVKNSRSDSKSRRLLARAPVEGGFRSSRMAITWASRRLAMMTSAFLPAVSTK